MYARKLNRTYRPVVVFIACCLLAVSVWADDSLPVIEVKADRTTIYPQRMDLTGEESLLDILQMVPDLMIAGYEELIVGFLTGKIRQKVYNTTYYIV